MKTEAEKAPVKKEMNNTVQFWRFLFTVFISFGHYISFGWRATGKVTDEFMFMGGGRVLGIFLFLGGYFMMVSYQNKKKKGQLDEKNPGFEAWKYTKNRWLALYPAMLGGVTFAFIARNIIAKTPLKMIPTLLARSMWEFLGLHQLGLIGYTEPRTTAQLVEAINDGGVQIFWNGPLWYLSAMLIVVVILYYILCKSENFFVGFFAPFTIIGSYGYARLNQSADFLRTTTGWLGIPNNLLRVAAGMCVGALLWYVVEYFKNKEFSKGGKVALTVLNGLLIVYFLYTVWNGIEWSEFANNAFIVPFVVIMLINKDYISTKLLNNKFSGWLGSLSLYYYCSHLVMVFIVIELFPEMSYTNLAIVFFCATFVWSIIMKLIDTKIVTPLVRKRLS